MKFPEQIGADLRHISKAKREEAIKSRRILKEWEQAVAAGFTLGFDKARTTHSFCERMLIERGLRLSKTTLYRWAKDYRARGLVGLIDSRGIKEDEPAPEDPFIADVKRLFLSLSKPKLSRCHDMAVDKAQLMGWEVRSYKACQRAIAAMPRGVVLKYRHGDEAYTNDAEPFLERDYSSLRSNQAWNADHHPIDVVVKAGGRLVRPWLTVFQDVRSRKIMGWSIYAFDPNTDVIMTTIRQAIIEHGVPEILFVDNGKDFDSYALNGRTKRDRWLKRRVHWQLDHDRADGLFAALEIEGRHVWPYHGQSKIVERWFEDYETYNTCWPTYCGSSPANKPEDLQLQLERGNAPTLEEYTAWFDQWLVAHDAGHKHSGDGMDGKTPDQVYAENLFTKRTATRELLDVLCLRPEGPVRIMQNGVNHKGLRFGQYEPQMQKRLGQQVMLRIDPRDLTHVQVWTPAPDDKFICLAQSNARIPFLADSQTLREAIGEKRQDRKLLSSYVDRRPRIAEDLPDRMLRAAAHKARQAIAANTEPPPPGPTLQPVRHAIEGQLPAIRRAVESRQQRVAVGAEMSSRFVGPQTSAAADEEVEPGPSFRELMANRPTEPRNEDE